ncbi:MAG: hypothetical protein E5X41_17115 [Mesorhizobium sp.]|nr:MAG: hypothetical protein E5X41_17115 [Mesorhizobium sp.]
MITQELFDTIYRGLAGQGWVKSYDQDADLCMYRGPNNHKCAIGHLIPDEMYHHSMDDSVAGVMAYGEFRKLELHPALTRDEFNELQDLHDSSDEDDPTHMRRRFEEFARNHNLVIPTP